VCVFSCTCAHVAANMRIINQRQWLLVLIIYSESKSKVVPVTLTGNDAMKAYRGSENIPPLIL
jgi:hypothetical protein